MAIAETGMGEAMAQLLATLDPMLDPLLEASVEYRIACQDAGFTPEDASRMAAEHHITALHMVRNALNQAARTAT